MTAQSAVGVTLDDGTVDLGYVLGINSTLAFQSSGSWLCLWAFCATAMT